MTVDFSVTKRQIEIDELNTVARIYRRRGSPYVNLITGREPHPTGQVTCIKAGMRAQAWESMRAEKPMIELCEVATPVHRLFAQPHNLIMKVVGEANAWRYRPDLQLEVDRAFAEQVTAGVPFARAVASWVPTGEQADTATMIVEVQDDDDRRIDHDRYNQKLRLAKEVYSAIGWYFTIVVRSRDIELPRIAQSVASMMMDHDTSIQPRDITQVSNLISECGGSARLSDVVALLGDRPIGFAKIAALHVRRIISVDLTKNLSGDSSIAMVGDGRAIFELPGRYPW